MKREKKKQTVKNVHLFCFAVSWTNTCWIITLEVLCVNEIIPQLKMSKMRCRHRIHEFQFAPAAGFSFSFSCFFFCCRHALKTTIHMLNSFLTCLSRAFSLWYFPFFATTTYNKSSFAGKSTNLFIFGDRWPGKRAVRQNHARDPVKENNCVGRRRRFKNSFVIRRCRFHCVPPVTSKITHKWVGDRMLSSEGHCIELFLVSLSLCHFGKCGVMTQPVRRGSFANSNRWCRRNRDDIFFYFWSDLVWLHTASHRVILIASHTIFISARIIAKISSSHV